VNRSAFDAVRDERPDGGPHKNAGHPAWQDDHAGDQPKAEHLTGTEVDVSAGFVRGLGESRKGARERRATNAVIVPAIANATISTTATSAVRRVSRPEVKFLVALK
jgi:hypothetical protein